jgi:hypothetical protein
MRNIIKTFVVLLIVSGFSLLIYTTLSGKITPRAYVNVPHHYDTHLH